MPARRCSPTAALRGGAVGATAGALAVAAHGVGGGALPGATALTLLLAASVAVGALTTAVPHLTRGRCAVLGALAAGQAAGHGALTVAANTTHTHVPADGGAATPTILAAHAAATVVCAALILAAERLYGPVSAVLRAVLAPPTLDVEPVRVLRPRPRRHHTPHPTLLAVGWSRRGPPVGA